MRDHRGYRPVSRHRISACDAEACTTSLELRWDGMPLRAVHVRCVKDYAHYETALDVFAHSRLISRRYPYDQVVVPPPA